MSFSKVVTLMHELLPLSLEDKTSAVDGYQFPPLRPGSIKFAFLVRILILVSYFVFPDPPRRIAGLEFRVRCPSGQA